MTQPARWSRFGRHLPTARLAQTSNQRGLGAHQPGRSRVRQPQSRRVEFPCTDLRELDQEQRAARVDLVSMIAHRRCLVTLGGFKQFNQSARNTRSSRCPTSAASCRISGLPTRSSTALGSMNSTWTLPASSCRTTTLRERPFLFSSTTTACASA